MTVEISGDWLDGRTYVAERIAGYWNGWAMPVVRRDVVDQLIADNEALRAHYDDDVDELWWEGDTLCRLRSQYDDATVERIAPRIDGLYDIGLDWCWYVVEATS